MMKRCCIWGAIVLSALALVSCKSDSTGTNTPITPPDTTHAFTYPGMKLIQGVTFQMGSDSLQNVDAQPVHRVTISAFYIDTTEVTQKDYTTLMGANPSVNTSNGDLCPVDNVSWYDAVLYCNARSKRDSLDTVYSYTSCTIDPSSHTCTALADLVSDYAKKGYHLPTEAEWEWAAKGGQDVDWLYYWPGDVNRLEYDWDQDNSDGNSHPVASKIPNGFGLYDMLGNIYEWVDDWWELWPASWPADSILVNPHGPATGTQKQMRGGSYSNMDEDIWLGDRDDMCSPDLAQARNGFRCAAKK